jgi:hypothetical protein
VSEDVGGTPFPDDDDHGDADEEFASVVFDEAFVRAAALHEPTARERSLAAAQARAEAEAARARVVGADDDGPDEDTRRYGDGFGPGRYEGHLTAHVGLGGTAWPRGQSGPYGSHTRWHRTIAWVLALIMGVGVVALTFAAVYRGAGGGSRQPAPPPATGRTSLPHPAVKAASPTAR